MVFWRTVVFIVGAGIVSWTVLSAIRTVILPRSAQSYITRFVFRTVRVPFAALAHERRTYLARDNVMAMFAPVGLVVLAGTWLALVTGGYTLMFWSLDTASLSEAFFVSGSSITTLGFAASGDVVERTLMFSEAGWGLFLVALMITYLPSMYGAFSRREAQVALLEVRAGTPPISGRVSHQAPRHRVAGPARSHLVRVGALVCGGREEPHELCRSQLLPISAAGSLVDHGGRHGSRLCVPDDVLHDDRGAWSARRVHSFRLYRSSEDRGLLRHPVQHGSCAR